MDGLGGGGTIRKLVVQPGDHAIDRLRLHHARISNDWRRLLEALPAPLGLAISPFHQPFGR